LYSMLDSPCGKHFTMYVNKDSADFVTNPTRIEELIC
jgi:hypothetical protein